MVTAFMLTSCGDCLQKNKFKEGSTILYKRLLANTSKWDDRFPRVFDEYAGLKAKQMLALRRATEIDDLHKLTDWISDCILCQLKQCLLQRIVKCSKLPVQPQLPSWL